ncbi:MAG: hypothetical protein ACXVEF_02060 [Polyangiales bacterium]
MAGMLLCAVLSGGWVALSFVGALFASVTGVPVSAAFALAVVFGCVVFSRTARAKAGPRAPLALALGAVSLAPFVFLGAMDALTRPLVSSHFRCGTGEAMAMMFAPFVLFAWAAVAVMLGFFVAGGRERRALDFATRFLAGLAVFAGLALVSLSSLRAMHRVEPDRWLASQGPGIDLGTLGWEGDSAKLDANRTLFRKCSDEGYCNVGFRQDTVLTEGVSVGRKGERASMVRAHGLTIFSGGDWSHGALDESGHRTDVQVSTVAGDLSAPRGWIVCGWIAVLAAGGFMLFARGRKVDVTGLHDGVVDATGAILLDDGTTWPQPLHADWSEGTRLIGRRHERIATFRDDTTPSFALGTLDGLRADGRIRTTVWAALALATILLGLAPLFAAMRLGIAL